MTISTDDAIRFGFLIHDVSRLRRVAIDRELKPLGITRSQWLVLVFLSRRDGMTQTALAADLDLTKVAIGSLLERMESARLVMRQIDQTDGRIRRVFLTESGSRLVREIRLQVEAIELELLGPNGEGDLQTTVAVLQRMKSLLLEKIDDSLAAKELCVIP